MKRRAGLLCIFGATVPFVVLVSAAWACGVLATAKVAPSTAAAGQTVQVTGSNYGRSVPDAAGTPPAFTPVSIRLDTRTGPVLKEVNPAPDGKINTTVQTPAVAAGDHILLATQNRISDGTPKAGTPGRTTMRVQGAAARGAAASSNVPAASPWSNSKPGAPGGSAASVDAGGSDVSPLLAFILSGALLSIGLALVGRDRASRGARRPLIGA